ncbi:hypothetical protein MC28_E133 (plasmid) [Bacillus thuringiensis MC28]|nr:hypothetical protein MC28_E133 [Bacillus thuringiensis MC28]
MEMGIENHRCNFFYRFSIGSVGKQSIYDFEHKKIPFQKK